jgi:uncharacterized protein (DUF488 family)
MSDETIRLFTMGFTKKSAEEFFTKLTSAGVRRLVDTRLNNVSQLAGFTKRDDLRFFLHRVANIEYAHMTELAPTQEILDAYKKRKGDWATYETRFLTLLESRRIEEMVPKADLQDACLLCSEETPEHCHRRLVAEYLKRKWGCVNIIHIP